MARAKSSGIVFLAVLAFALQSNGACAQSLSLWGGWNDGGDGWQGTQSGRPPASAGSGLFSYGTDVAFPPLMDGGPRPYIEPQAPQLVSIPSSEAAGTVLIDNSTRTLYYVVSPGMAYAYPISVGRDGFTWTGVEEVSRIADWPDWHPPEEMRIRDPRLPIKMTGGLKNPLGAVSIYLGKSLYRIHGTNDPKTIGYAASSGCFRMLNAHALHLASLVHVGTVVKVMDWLPRPGEAGPDELPWLAKPQAGHAPQPERG